MIVVGFACWTSLVGCQLGTAVYQTIAVDPLGQAVDAINLRQEENAEANKFVVYMHEFEVNQPRDFELATEPLVDSPPENVRGFRLNTAGQDHVRQIARQLMNRIDAGDTVPAVVVEQSNTSKMPNTVFEYPVHRNPELDSLRREVVVRALEGLGVDHAESYVLVAPVAANGLSAREAAAAYERSVFFGGRSQGRGFGGVRSR